MKTYRCSALVLFLGVIFIARVYADGAYQRTDDRKKTFVWNNDPQPGDTATWSGQRDTEGYATGPGTLTWSRLDRGFTTGSNITITRKRTPISSYTGTMVRGKFNGSVTTVDHGKTYYAKFVDGQRKGNWSTSPLVAKEESVEATPAPAKPKPTKAAIASTSPAPPPAAKPPPSEKVAEEKKETHAAEEPDIPAAGPTEEKPTLTIQQPAATESGEASKPATPLIAQTSTEESDLSATPRPPVTRKGALAPGAVRAIDRPTDTAPKKSQNDAVKQSARAKTTEKPAKAAAKPAPSQPSETETQPSEDVPAAGPAAVAKEEATERSETAKQMAPSADISTAKPPEPPKLKTEAAAKEKPVDDSIRTLMGPPSSLHTKSALPGPETPPTQSATDSSAATAPKAAAAPKLTAVQAMDIADIEARTRGYDLGEYQLPKADYNASNDTWSVAYVGHSADGTAKKLNVIVQDKSGKAEVKK